MRAQLVLPVLLSVLSAVGSSCSSSGRGRGTDGPMTTRADGGDGSVSTRADSSVINNCTPSGNEDLDQDGDGFTGAQGDCNDCDSAANPGAFDFPGNGADEDCSGDDASEAEAYCDSGLAVGSTDPNDAVKSIGLCKFTTSQSKEWGVISAKFTKADGLGEPAYALQMGLLSSLGVAEPQAGESMLALSSGTARAPGQSGFTSSCDFFDVFPSGYPTGFPVESPSCPGVRSGEVYDPVALEVRVRVPTNAKSFSFNSNFYTYEYPNYICSEFNDFFVTLMSPRVADLENDNIVFDSDGNLVSVNSSLLQVCEPGNHGGKAFACPEGDSQLGGSGFEAEYECGQTDEYPDPADGAATGWLQTKAPVESGGVVTLRFAIWDSGDPLLDSTVLIDGFRWEVDEATVGTTPVLR